MNYFLLASAAAALVGSAAADATDFRFSGFGTLGVVHSSEKNADFIGTTFQPDGAGASESWSFGPDTKLGVQANVAFTDKFSVVLQVISQHQYDDTWTPQIEWANVKYQVTPQFSVRLGRIVQPTFLMSESRFVGYAYSWVRPPDDVYKVTTITSNDGVDAAWRIGFGRVNNTLQAFYGGTTLDAPTATGKVKHSWGLANSMEIGSLTLRAGYTAGHITVTTATLDGFYSGLTQFAAGAAQVPLPAFQTAATQALALTEKYDLNNIRLSTVVVGASYDPGNWFVMGEWVGFNAGGNLLSDSHSWYLSGGWRWHSLTPYATYATTRSYIESEPGIATAGLGAVPPLAAAAAGLNAGVNATLIAFATTQSTVTLGLRWDFKRNMALKGQYDWLHLGDNSPNGRLLNNTGAVPDRHIDLFSVALDWVF
jgi:hypothetical protein